MKKNILHQLFLAGFLVCLASQLHGQSEYRQENMHDYQEWIFGINAGIALQQSDVNPWIRGYGIGVTLGQSTDPAPERKWSLGYRGRFLYSQTYGLDTKRNYNISGNTAVNGSGNWNYLEYPDPPSVEDGYIYNNHKTHFGEINLEAVLTLDNLNRKDNLFAAIFGGLGLAAVFTLFLTPVLYALLAGMAKPRSAAADRLAVELAEVSAAGSPPAKKKRRKPAGRRKNEGLAAGE